MRGVYKTATGADGIVSTDFSVDVVEDIFNLATDGLQSNSFSQKETITEAEIEGILDTHKGSVERRVLSGLISSVY